MALLRVALLVLLAGCGQARKPSPDTPFFPELPELRGSSLDIDHFRSGESDLEALIDQGIPGVADVSDVFRVRSTGRIVVGGAPEARPILAAALDHVAASARRAWHDQAAAFAADVDAGPTSEGILAERTRSLLVPTLRDSDPGFRNAAPILNEIVAGMTRVIETRSDVPVTRVRTHGGPWLQDFLTAFDDGTLGIPPHLDEASFRRAANAVPDQAADFIIGGKALTMGRVIETPLRDLRDQGRRFRQLRALVEGGNVVFAHAADGGVRAILGSHTVRLTRSVYQLDDAGAIAMLAEDFGLDPRDVVVISQPDYHIDLYLRAAGPGQIFLADLAHGLDLLQRLALDPASPQRDALEALRQRAARSGAHPVGANLARALRSARASLEAAGFDVIAYPSVYYSYFNTGEYENVDGAFVATSAAHLYVHVNTMNGRYVTDSDGRVMSFVLSSGYDAFDRSIEAFELEHGVDEVYFLGRRLAAPRFWGNQILLSAAGVGCLTNL